MSVNPIARRQCGIQVGPGGGKAPWGRGRPCAGRDRKPDDGFATAAPLNHLGHHGGHQGPAGPDVPDRTAAATPPRRC